MKVVELGIRRISWQETIALSQEILWPKKSAEFSHVKGDEDAWHFGGYIEGELVSVASIHRHMKNVRLRKNVRSQHK